MLGTMYIIFHGFWIITSTVAFLWVWKN